MLNSILAGQIENASALHASDGHVQRISDSAQVTRHTQQDQEHQEKNNRHEPPEPIQTMHQEPIPV